jgi:peptidoglycan/xylan/chitin deacetylase (PgdA/CDA1 family)
MKRILLESTSRLRLNSLWRAVHTSSVPVLLFHGVVPDADTNPVNFGGKLISPEQLRTFLHRLERIFRAISIDEFVEAAMKRQKIKNAMVITFDDGYSNVYTEAFPVLRELGFPFCVFMTTGNIDTDAVLWTDILPHAIFTTEEATLPEGILDHDLPLRTDAEKHRAVAELKNLLKQKPLEEVNDIIDSICERLRVPRQTRELQKFSTLTSQQIKEMSDSGVVFGGHTVTHPILSRESVNRIQEEVVGCKEALERITGKTVRYFAYPNGTRDDFNQTVKDELRRAGYVAAFTTIAGLYYEGDDLSEVKRIGVANRWTYWELEARASGLLSHWMR